MDAALTILTGSPAVNIAGEPHRLSPLNLTLLVRLRYAEHPIPRSDLAKLFWPNTPGRPNLSTALRSLRSVLGEAYIPLNEDPIALGRALPADTDLIEAAAMNPTSDAVHAALAAYRAPFLVGLDGRLPTTALTEWVVAQRERYRMLLVESVEAACRGAVAANDWREVEALAAAAEERGLASEAVREWRLETMRRKAVVAPAPRGRRPGLPHFVWIFAAVLLAGSVFALTRRIGDGRGECAAHLVRKEYKPEINNALAPGRTYTPLWVLRNDGKCTWDSAFALRRVSTLGSHPLDLETDVLQMGREVPPGDSVTISHKVTAPSTPGDYGETWVLMDGKRRPVLVDGSPELLERFQVLPQPLSQCTGDDVRSGYLAASHPDSARVRPNEAFVATWTVINRGKCIWKPEQVAIRFAGGSGRRMSNPRIMELRTDEPIRPTDSYTFEVPMRSPASGSAVERWSVRPGTAQPAEVLVLRASVRDASSPNLADSGVRECKPGEEIVGWIRSERVQDSTVVTAGDTVRKSWTLRNEGECTWAPGSLTLHFAVGTPQKKDTFPLTHAVPPNATYTFSVPLIAPPGKRLYEERWQLVNRNGGRIRIGHILTLYALIKVRPAARLTRNR